MLLACLHGGSFVLVGVIVPEDVQHAMDDQERQLVVDGSVVAPLPNMQGGLAGGVDRTDDDIADEIVAERVVIGAVERKREYVGRPMLTHVFAVEVGHHRLVDEQEVELTLGDALADQAVAGEPSRIFRDPIERCIWAAMNGGFLGRIDECERVKSFDEFPLLHGLEGKLTLSDMRFDKDWVWAETSRGVCRYSRSDGDWQFIRTVKRLRDLPSER